MLIASNFKLLHYPAFLGLFIPPVFTKKKNCSTTLTNYTLPFQPFLLSRVLFSSHKRSDDQMPFDILHAFFSQIFIGITNEMCSKPSADSINDTIIKSKQCRSSISRKIMRVFLHFLCILVECSRDKHAFVSDAFI